MKKEVLISLLMTQPVAFTAMADVDAQTVLSDVLGDKGNWNTQGNELTVADGHVTAVVGSVFKYNVTLAPGKYTISLPNASNAKVVVDGAETKDDGSVSFTLAEEKDVEFRVEAADSTSISGFMIEKVVITLNFDESTALAALKNNLDAEYAKVITLADEESSLIKDDKEKVDSAYNNILAMIPVLQEDGESTRPVYSYDVYKKLHLNLYPGYLEDEPNPADDITKAIKAFAEDVSDYNKKANDEQSRQNIHSANSTQYNELHGKLEELEKAYGELVEVDDPALNDYINSVIDRETMAADTLDLATKINEAFADYLANDPDEQVVSEDTVNSLTELADSYAAYFEEQKAKYNAAKEDYDAHQKILAAVDSLTAAYNSAIIKITEQKPNEGWEDRLYGSYQGEKKTEIAKIYNDAIAAIGDTSNADGWAGKIGDSADLDLEALAKEAATEITGIAEQFETDVNFNNDEKTKADSRYSKRIIKKYDKAYGWYTEGMVLPKSIDSERKRLVNAIDAGKKLAQDSINNLYLKMNFGKNASEAWAKYKNLIIPVEAYIDTLAALGTSPLIPLQDGLNSVVKEIENNDSLLGDDFHLKAKFQDIIDDLQGRLDEYDADVIDVPADDFKEGLETLQKNAKAVYDAISKAKEGLDGLSGAITEMKRAFNKKTLVDPNAKKDGYWNGKAEDLTGQYKVGRDWKTYLNTITGEFKEFDEVTNPDGNYVVKVQEFTDSLESVDKVIADKYLMLKAMTDANDKYVKAQIDEVMKIIPQFMADNKLEKLGGYNEETFGKEVNEEYGKIHDAIEAITADNEDFTGAYAAQDTELNKLLNEVGALKSEANGLMDNYQAYRDQFNEGKDMLNYINVAYAELAKKDPSIEKVGEWKDALDEISKALNDIDSEVLAAYNNGESKDKNDEIMGKYEEQKKQIDEVLKEMAGEYGTAIINQNEQLIIQYGWSEFLRGLWNAYDDAVGAYVWYRDKLGNAGYKTAVAGTVQSSKDIYNAYTPIRKLESEVKQYKDSCNIVPCLITEEDINGFKATGNQIKTDSIDAKRDAMEAAMLAAAEGYYNVRQPLAQQTIEDAIAKMQNAGIVAKLWMSFVSGAQLYNQAAVDLYNSANEESLLAHRMDTIADNLDRVIAYDFMFNTAAKTQWKSDYKAASDKLSELQEALAGYLNDDQQQHAIDSVAGIKELIAAIDTEALADEELIDRLVGYNEELDELLSQAEGAVNESKARHDARTANEDLWAEYDGNYTSLDTLLAQAKSYINTLAANVSYSDAETALSAFKNAYNDEYRNVLVENKASIDKLFETAKAEIELSIEREADAEVEWLNTQLGVVKAAFNDYKLTLAELTPEEVEEALKQYNDRIEEATTGINGIDDQLKASADPAPTTDSRLALQEEMKAIEAALCNLEVELKDKAGQPNPVEPIVDALQGLYDEISGAITAADDELNNDYHDNIKAEYEEKYNSLQGTLDDIKAAVDAAGNNVIANKENYTNAMNAVKAELEDAVKAAADAEAAADAHDDLVAANEAAYTRLSNEIDEIESALNELVALIESCDYTADQYQQNINYISNNIDAAREAISTAKANLELTDDSLLVSYYNELESDERMIPYLKSEVISAEFEGWKEAAHNSVTEWTLPANMVKGERERIKALIAEQAAACNNLPAEWIYSEVDEDGNEVEVKDYALANQTIADAKAIVAAMAEILGQAEEAKYVVGDADCDGKFDIADIQTIIEWVGTKKDDFEGNEKGFEAADLNGDGKLNTADVVSAINLFMNPEPTVGDVALLRVNSHSQAVSGANTAALELVSNEDGVRRFAINISNSATFVGGQLDILVPSGMEVVNVLGTERMASQDMYRFDNSQGMRLVFASMTNEEIAEHSGAVIYVDVKGSGNITIENVIFADRNAVTYNLSVDISGVTNPVYNTLKNVKEAIYDISGRAYKSVVRGINIIRHSDGSVTKEYKK